MDKRLEKTIGNAQDYQRTFGSAHGKRVLWDMMKAHSVVDSTFVPRSVHETILREGERNTVLRILTLLKIDPAKLRELSEEGEQTDDRNA